MFRIILPGNFYTDHHGHLCKYSAPNPTQSTTSATAGIASQA